MNFLRLPVSRSVRNYIKDSNEMLSKILEKIIITDLKKSPNVAKPHLRSASSVFFFKPILVLRRGIEVSLTLKLIPSP